MATSALVERLQEKMPALCGILLATLIFLPPFSVGAGLPAFEVVDFLMPVLVVIVILLRRSIYFRGFFLLLSGFGLCILVAILLNGRLRIVSDYFEIYKLARFAVIISLFSFVRVELFINRWIKPLFVLLVVFNLVHYFNLFGFNSFLDEMYFGPGKYNTFGLNSAGIPTTKRMLGFAANPNNNAYIFFTFLILFLPKKKTDSAGWFFVAVVMMFLCQSRTAVLALPFVLVAYAFLWRPQIKQALIVLAVVLAGFAGSYAITLVSTGAGTPVNQEMLNAFLEENPDVGYDADTGKLVRKQGNNSNFTYIESMLHGEFSQGTSMSGRYEIWKQLWTMIKNKPVFGHGPYKEFFYDNKLYAENEFVFMAWRYGFFGLILYCCILFVLAIKAYRNRSLESGTNLALVLILFLFVSLTNLPFSVPTLNMLFAVMIGLFFAEQRTSKDVVSG